MKRLLTLPALALALLVAAGGAPAAHGDTKKACADIVDGSLFYSANGVASADITLAAASCKTITYTLFVVDEESGNVYTASTTGDGSAFFADGTDLVQLSAAVTSDSDGNVCAYATSAKKNGGVLDRAPDSGCVPLSKGGSGAGGSFN